MLSFIGIIVGLVFFVALAYRGFNLILSAVFSSCIMLAFSGMNVLDGLREIYLPGLAMFLKNYFLIFFLSALLGKLMSDGGNAKRIALCLTSLIKKSKNNQQFFCVMMVPVLYFLLCYAGISGFVVVFTVLPIAKKMFEETNTPWRLYCCAGAQTINAAILGGSLQACNIYAADICGTTITAGWKLSLFAVCVFWLISVFMLWLTLKSVKQKQEGFMPSGKDIKEAVLDTGVADECLPGIVPSILPLVVVLVLSAGLKTDVVIALSLGCLVTILTGAKNLFPHLGRTLSAGAASVYGPILSVSATYAIGAVLKTVEGFSYFEAFLEQLPALVGAPLLGLVTAFIMASSAAPIPAFGPQMLQQYIAAGISAENAHRMMMITSFTSIAPHNAGISNAASVLRLPYSECLKMYIIYTYIPGAITVLAVLAYLII